MGLSRRLRLATLLLLGILTFANFHVLTVADVQEGAAEVDIHETDDYFDDDFDDDIDDFIEPDSNLVNGAPGALKVFVQFCSS
mmetsp:Transcript_8918/g.10202  ORF Transcript_8918/g.10202 Transcript_8918/m.10202 type:complete len:83 (+) Transcript_8918:168-416(+)